MVNKTNMEQNKDTQSKNIVVFENNSYLTFLYKKTEKITTALYMITNILSNEEPLKWRLRDKSTSLLSDILCLSNDAPSSRVYVQQQIRTNVIEIMSLLEIVFRSGGISEMNFTVLKREYESLILTLDEATKTHTQSLFSSDFFEVTAPSHGKDERHKRGDSSVSQERLESSPVVMETLNKSAIQKGDVKDKTTYKKRRPFAQAQFRSKNRREVILGVVRSGQGITIKDVTPLIEGCSEKTIQRELLAMVDEGLLKREGKKRWSTYSLA